MGLWCRLLKFTHHCLNAPRVQRRQEADMPFWYHKSYAHWLKVTDLARNALYDKYVHLTAKHFGLEPGASYDEFLWLFFDLISYPASAKVNLEGFFFDEKKNPCGGADKMILTLHPHKMQSLYQILHFHYLGLCIKNSHDSAICLMVGASHVYPYVPSGYAESWYSAARDCFVGDQPWSVYTSKLTTELTALLQNVMPGDYIPTRAECESFLHVVDYIENGSQALRIDPAFQASVKKILRSR
jgi:hypothetical protein